MTFLERLLSPPPRCVVLGCTRPPNGRKATLCAEHELDLKAKIKRVVERLRLTPENRP